MRYREIENARLKKIWMDTQVKLRETRSRYNESMAKLQTTNFNDDIDKITS